MKAIFWPFFSPVIHYLEVRGFQLSVEGLLATVGQMASLEGGPVTDFFYNTLLAFTLSVET